MKYIILISVLLAGCANKEVQPNRAGCTFLDGEGRYGTLLNYVKGDAEGVYIYLGDDLPPGTTITCNTETHEIKITVPE